MSGDEQNAYCPQGRERNVHMEAKQYGDIIVTGRAVVARGNDA